MFSCYCRVHSPALHPFPTRRSSDLVPFLGFPDREVWIYRLLEHQSKHDPMMGLRLYDYMGELWRLQSTCIRRPPTRSEEHTSELQSPDHLVCRLLLEKKNNSIELTS